MTSWSVLVISLFLLVVVMTTCGLEQENIDEGGTCSDHEDGTKSCSHRTNMAMLCRDEDARCLFWAERGECSRNPTFMERTCPQSCELCIGRLEDWEDEDCQDMHPKCAEWAESGECVANPSYMLSACKKSCVKCVDVKVLREEGMDEGEILRRYRYVNGNWGPIQDLGTAINARTKAKSIAIAMHKYAMDNVTTYPLSMRIQCNNSKTACIEWASMNECEANLHYMMVACPLACRVCDKRVLYDKCKNDSPTNPWLPENGFKQLFEHLKLQKHAELLTVGDNVKDLDSPWVLKWDDFLSSKDVSALLSLAKSLTWEDSTPVGSMNHNHVRRLSRSAYCKDCPKNNNAVYKKLQQSLSNLVQADLKYMEPFEFVHYQKMQSYGAHHDLSLHDLWLPAGPRVLSIFLCLSDVPQGGAMGFPDMDWLSIPPKKGQLLIWPNVLNSDFSKSRTDMSNEALPVLEGEKFGIHTWVRLYDYEEAERKGCV